MHVCVTFLPISERVELQNIGRTARQGKKRSAAKGSKNHDGTQNSGKSQDSAEGKLNKLLVGDKYEKKNH